MYVAQYKSSPEVAEELVVAKADVKAANLKGNTVLNLGLNAAAAVNKSGNDGNTVSKYSWERVIALILAYSSLLSMSDFENDLFCGVNLIRNLIVDYAEAVYNPGVITSAIQ